MATVTYHDHPDATTPAAGTEELPMWTASAAKKMTLDNVVARLKATANTWVLGQTFSAIGTFNLGLSVSGAALNMNSQLINAVATPVSATDAANKAYVDATAQGLKQKPTATVATTAALAACTYANGSSGVGATLTGDAVGVLTVDSYAVLLNDLVLVKNQASGLQNGLYLCTTEGTAGVAFVLTRSTSMDLAAEFPGGFIPVEDAGTANANSLWLCTNTAAPTVGTTAIVFVQLNKGTDLAAGTGITITANSVAINQAAALTWTAQQTFHTAAGTVPAVFRGYAPVESGAESRNGSIFIGSTATFQGVIQYDLSGANPQLLIDNTYDDVGAWMRLRMRTAGTALNVINLLGSGNVGLLGVVAPEARLHLPAGAAAANRAPLKFTSGTNLTTAENGAMEYDGTNLFFTRAGAVREGIICASAVTTEVLVPDTSVTININGTTYKLLARA